MPIQPIVKERASQFKGLITNADPRDIGAAATVVQDNIQCLQDGAATVRGGMRPGTFANGISSVAGQVMSLFYYRAAVTDWIVFQQSDGTVRVGKGYA